MSEFCPGRFQGGTFEMPIRIYYADTDAGGIVYHAAFFDFGERCRSEMLRALGLPLTGADGTGFVARRGTIDWLRPARLNDLLICSTDVTAIGGSSLGLRHVFWRREAAIARIELTLVHVSGEGRPRRLPADLRAAFDTLQDPG